MGLESLDETTKFIEQQWNQEIADIFLDKLDERIGQLQDNPELGPVYKQTEFRRLLIHRLVTLYYAIEDDFINLVLVWANKQGPEELRKKLKTDANRP